MKKDPIDEFRRQGDVEPPDNFHRIMPVAVFRVTWKEAGENKEAWFRTEEEAFRCKYGIDHSYGKQEYLNFERWYAYREYEHEDLIGPVKRERGWWHCPRPRVVLDR
jgi:hypothetical protein